MSLLPPTTLDTGYLAAVRKLRVSNAAAEVIPPHALLRVTGNDADGLLTVAKPNADSLPYLLVNGPLPIAVGATGLATFDEPTPVSYDDAHTPAAGDTWGSANGSWLLTHGKTGWRVMGSPDTESAVVEAVREVGGPITTANVDTTQESTTTRLEFDQGTGVRVDKGAADADPDVVSIDVDTLSDILVMDKSAAFVTQACIELTVTKTYSTNPGETHLLTDVAVSAALVLKRRSVSLLSGTVLGAEVCVAAETSCCTPVEDPVTVCAGLASEATVSHTLKVVVSGGPTFFITYDSGAVWWQGYVNAFDCTDGFGLTLTPNCDGTWDMNTVASFRGPATATVTPTLTSPFLLTVTGATESGLCGGTVTFTVSEV